MPIDQPNCYRCNDTLDKAHQATLSSAYEGVVAERFRDIDRHICLDCLAAIGMLEFADEGLRFTDGQNT